MRLLDSGRVGPDGCEEGEDERRVLLRGGGEAATAQRRDERADDARCDDRLLGRRIGD